MSRWCGISGGIGPDIRLETDEALLDVTPMGGAVWRWHAKTPSGPLALLREPPDIAGRHPLHAGCFPLVPFGNRVRGNRFCFEGRGYGLQPNTDEGLLYLHGDGWTSVWEVTHRAATSVSLAVSYDGPATPYRYDAEQQIVLDGTSLTLGLRVTNRGEPLPFGLGWHPFFPLTPRTVLTGRAAAMWGEDAQFLPTTRLPVPDELDFGSGRRLPRHWLNTPFEGWDGRAAIARPEADGHLVIEADPLFDRYLVFVSDAGFDPGYAYEWFCFEPMSHAVDAHNRADGGGLVRLAPGEFLSGSIRLSWIVGPATER